MTDKRPDIEKIIVEVTELTQSIGPQSNCPQCGAGPNQHSVRNYNMMWHDGDVYCNACGTFVRPWDAG